jgi:predicted nucleic acid-binding protein
LKDPAYFDTSVIVKRYVAEAGSKLADRFIARHDVVASALIDVELPSALFRRWRDGSIAASDADAAVREMRAHQRRWLLIDVSVPVLRRAGNLVRETPVRTLDAIHVASCLEYQIAVGTPVSFITADARQRRAAEAARLEVVWVG